MYIEMCDRHCRTEVCDLCGAEIPAHDSGLCIWCEEKLLEMPEKLWESGADGKPVCRVVENGNLVTKEEVET